VLAYRSLVRTTSVADNLSDRAWDNLLENKVLYPSPVIDLVDTP
jgi:hypothetical protein